MRDGWTKESAQAMVEGEITNYANLLIDSTSVYLQAYEQPNDRRACERLIARWMQDSHIEPRGPIVINPPCDIQDYGLPRDRM